MSATPSPPPPCLIQPPVAPQKLHYHKFGAVEGEDRGSSLISPPITRADYYAWMRDDTRQKEDILYYLKSENEYCTAMCNETGISKLEKVIEAELLTHYAEDETEVPFPWGSWFYYSRRVKGGGYPIYCRRRREKGVESAASELSKEGSGATQDVNNLQYKFSDKLGRMVGEEEVIFDVNKMAEGSENYFFGDYSPNPDHTVIAYTENITGDEIYEIHFKDVSQPKSQTASQPLKVTDVIKRCSREVIWDRTGNLVFYITLDVDYRPFRLFMHRLGTPQEEDVCLYEETDKEFPLEVCESSSGQFLFLQSSAQETNVTRYLDLKSICDDVSKGGAAAAKECLKLVTERQENLRYEVEHWGDYFWIVTNKDGAVEGKLVLAPLSSPSISNWKDVFDYSEEINLLGVTCFENNIVLECREGGLEVLWVLPPKSIVNNMFPTPNHQNTTSTANKLQAPLLFPSSSRRKATDVPSSSSSEFVCNKSKIEGRESVEVYKLPAPEECYTIAVGTNYDYETCVLRYSYSSMVTPRQTCEFDMITRQAVVVKEAPVLNFDKSKYKTKRLHIPSGDDGITIPLSLVYSHSIYPNGPCSPSSDSRPPLILYGYGSYCMLAAPRFDFKRLPYLDRGYIYAIGHIRGGGEMGRHWNEKQGKFLTKKNTFKDFIQCAEYLQQEGYTASDRTAIIGRSAGGLLIGSCINQRPDLFKAAVADVPFVDIMNTMCDPSIPLTTAEWQEWGNPNQKLFYSYMLDYSPYDNIRDQDYPNLLVTGGLHDPRVGYWEPAKWVAKLRKHKTDNNLLLFKTNMAAGHFSSADRYKDIKESALEVAFLLSTIGCCKDLSETKAQK